LSLAKELYELAIIRMNNLNNTKDKLALAHSRDSLLFECSFNQIDCNPSDFAWSFHRYRGNCFVFNDGKKDNHVKNSFLSGFIYGLKIKFYTGHYEKLDSFLSYLDILGVNVKIENNSFMRIYIEFIFSALSEIELILHKKFHFLRIFQNTGFNR
jgi:hypothetical protein